jgi:NAD(P)H-hydrate epimerase
MAQVDANAAALGVSQKQLMESSGNAVARTVREVSAPGDRVVVVAGRGNNGGDGFVAARFLDDREVSVLLLGRVETIATDIARENWEALVRAGYDLQEVRDATALPAMDADVIVDAMLGTGVTGDLREPAASAARAMNDATATVVSVDVPSGVDADTGDRRGVAVDADRVVTFHDAKPGLTGLDATVTVADIGIPAAAETDVGPGDRLALSRGKDAHKGDHGEVLVVGGGPYTGAPALAARAALRGGADLVRVAVPETVARTVQGYDESTIVRELPGDRLRTDHVDRIVDLSGDHDTVVLGPGLGDDADTLTAVREFLSAVTGRVVVDADALAAVPSVDTDATLVCTPHRGELRGMGGPEVTDPRADADAVAAIAADLEAVLLVKGATDIVTDGTEMRFNTTGNPGMTVGGTGDVLAGLTGALTTTLSPLQAAAVAAYANGRAGDLAVGVGDDVAGITAVGGYGLLPTDLVDTLPRALWGEQ